MNQTKQIRPTNILLLVLGVLLVRCWRAFTPDAEPTSLRHGGT